MSSGIKRLAGETVIYGLSTIIGRLLNWLLIPALYVRTNTTEEIGALGEILAFAAILLVIFTYGLETGFFRFSKDEDKKDVYKTTMMMLTVSSSALILLTLIFAPNFSNFLGAGKHLSSLYLVGIIIALDSFISIPFAKLRLENKAFKFAIIKIINISLIILFNFTFLLIIPYFIKNNSLPQQIIDIYNSQDKLFYIFLSNLIASASMFLFFIKDLKNLSGKFNKNIAKRMLRYSLPVLLVGLTGMIIQNSDRLLMSKLVESDGMMQTGLYTVNFKIGVLMSLYTQSFRFSFEPFFFKNREKGKEAYSKAMEYFVFFGMFIFLSITLFLDVINMLITNKYAEGNIIIPFVLIGFLFFGIYYNLSLWYKLTDKTIWGVYFGVAGMSITLTLNFLLVPKIGIIGGAIALASGYFVMMVMSYLKGRKVYPVDYDLKKIGIYFFSALIFYLTYRYANFEIKVFDNILRVCILVFYVYIFFKIKKAKITFYKNNSVN